MVKAIIAFVRVLLHPNKATQAIALVREGYDVVEAAQDALTLLTKETALSRSARDKIQALAKEIAEFTAAMRRIRE